MIRLLIFCGLALSSFTAAAAAEPFAPRTVFGLSAPEPEPAPVSAPPRTVFGLQECVNGSCSPSPVYSAPFYSAPRVTRTRTRSGVITPARVVRQETATTFGLGVANPLVETVVETPVAAGTPVVGTVVENSVVCQACGGRGWISASPVAFSAPVYSVPENLVLANRTTTTRTRTRRGYGGWWLGKALGRPTPARFRSSSSVYAPAGQSTFQHLTGSPHYVPASSLYGMSESQLVALHTRLHGG